MLPLAAVLLSDNVHAVIAGHSGKLGTFGHGYTASGHPVATAVALENIRIIEERGLVSNAAQVGAVLQSSLRALGDHPLIGEVRGVGLLAAVELVADKASRRPFEPLGKVGAAIYERAHHHGLIVRGIPPGSGRPDSNRRPPAPKAGALPGCATPRKRRQMILLANGEGNVTRLRRGTL